MTCRRVTHSLQELVVVVRVRVRERVWQLIWVARPKKWALHASQEALVKPSPALSLFLLLSLLVRVGYVCLRDTVCAAARSRSELRPSINRYATTRIFKQYLQCTDSKRAFVWWRSPPHLVAAMSEQPAATPTQEPVLGPDGQPLSKKYVCSLSRLSTRATTIGFVAVVD
jgi:hypothetical protein